MTERYHCPLCGYITEVRNPNVPRYCSRCCEHGPINAFEYFQSLEPGDVVYAHNDRGHFDSGDETVKRTTKRYIIMESGNKYYRHNGRAVTADWYGIDPRRTNYGKTKWYCELCGRYEMRKTTEYMEYCGYCDASMTKIKDFTKEPTQEV